MGLLDIFRRKKGATPHIGTQTRSGAAHPFTALRQYVPNRVNVALYKQMREAIPVLDVGIQNLRRLIGTPEIKVGSPSSRRQKEWENWQRSVKVGKTGKGFDTFLSMYTDIFIQNGFSAAEILPSTGKRDIYALIPIDGEVIVVKDTQDPTELILAERRPMEVEPMPYQTPEWILYSAYEATPKNPYGRGIMTGLPFLVDILLTIFNATGRNWERFGDLKYSVDIQLPDGINSTQAQEFIKQAEASWKATMEKNRQGKVQDFIATNVKVSVIGADAKQLDLETPVKTILEQIVAKTGLPPFVFGFSWSARESMTKTQADILTSLIDDWRRLLEPVVRQIVEWWCKFRGYPIDYKIEWPEASLQDIEGMANAEYTSARAENQRLQNIMLARDLEEQGYIEPDVVQEMIEARSKGRRTKAKRATKDTNDDIDPERLPQKERDTRKIDQIAVKFERDNVNKLLKVRQKLVRFMEDRAEKSFHAKSIDPEEIRQVVEQEIDLFIAACLDSSGQLSFYDVLLRNAALAGLEAAVEDIKRTINDQATVQTTFDFGAEYVRTLRNEGMDRVTTKVKEIKDACIDIMERHGSVGDNPEEWARSLQRELGSQLDEPRWYWRRLGRSEAAMMFDRASETEYQAQGMEYCKWIIAPDACEKCRQYANKIFPLLSSPQVVVDTHPHCRCRKMAVTTDTANERGVEIFTRKEVNNIGQGHYTQKHKHEGSCGCH